MDLRTELEAIRSEYDYLDPELLVEVARPPDHPLHSRVFDRPPEQAAESWYRHRAHELIQSVKITVSRGDGEEPLTVRAFQAVPRDGGYVYEPTEEVAQDPVSRELVLREMEREWRQLLARYQGFEEFLTMVKADVT